MMKSGFSRLNPNFLWLIPVHWIQLTPVKSQFLMFDVLSSEQKNQETAEPPVLAAFGGLAALLLLNVGPLGYTKKDMKIHGFKGDFMEIYPLVN